MPEGWEYRTIVRHTLLDTKHFIATVRFDLFNSKLKMSEINDIVEKQEIGDQRLHPENYLSDARKTAPEKLKTVIRHPIREV